MTTDLHDPLDVVARRIRGALDILLEALDTAVAEAAAELSRKKLDPEDDSATYCANVRFYLRNQIRSIFTNLDKRESMSPVHLLLGPYTVLLGHSRNGDVPRAQSSLRKLLYGRNDVGIMAMNMFDDDVLVEIEPDVDFVTENTLVLVWDAKGGVLTQADLCRPYLYSKPQSINLLRAVEPESDLDEISRKSSGEEAEGVVGGEDELPSAEALDTDESEEDGENA
jgi:hypothetical protein